MGTDLLEELQSDRLFARPSFVEGVARMVDLSNSLNTYNSAPTGDEADALAIQHDWEAVGHDVRVAIDQIAADADLTDEAE